ncbi:hypothetical protein [Flavobacterium sp. AG291]|uniref:hypothetical protein n=1 Tax=Flavobacterium sp. AG291 TaxID=2184000 RepID=UPI000E0C0B9A|nr:hypothetical protein [Flavobacterium sp. AG291]RDI14424.1 hypothetical protein DEU42_102117 [Flavobacterium sp. AG291]
MQLLKPTPYNRIENQDYSELTIKILKQVFTSVIFTDGQMTFSFSNCKFKKLIIENNEDIEFENISISFLNCYIEELEVKNIQSKNISISFYSTLLSGIIENDNIKSVHCNNCLILDNLFLIKIKSVHISYTEENIFPIRWRRLFKSLRVDYKYILKRKQTYRIYDCSNLHFSSNENRLEKRGVYRRNHENLHEYKIGYFLTDDQKALFDINLHIKYSPEIDHKETKIINTKLNSLSLAGHVKGHLSIESTKVNNWYIRDFTTEFGASFYNILPSNITDSKIEIHKANLDKSWFDNIAFSSYKIVSFYRTKFGKTTFTSCDFPTNSTSFESFKALENIHYPDKKPDKYYKDQYEIFLQLKVQLEGTGNFYESQKLQAISNDALMKIEDISCWDKFILHTNSLSNNHGLSIARPLKWFALFSFVLYILYLISVRRILLNTDFDPTLIGYYFSFIDLTHRNDFLVGKEDFSAWTLSIDYINKVLTGYFIYQFISAFRKYGKK